MAEEDDDDYLRDIIIRLNKLKVNVLKTAIIRAPQYTCVMNYLEQHFMGVNQTFTIRELHSGLQALPGVSPSESTVCMVVKDLLTF